MELIHDVYDTDSRFGIDPTTRAITKISEGDVKLVQYDHNSERFAFEIPREVDGHDMSLCTSATIHYINIGNEERNEGVYDVDDLQIDPEDENKVLFSWLISQNATTYNGVLNFAIRFKCVNDEGATVYIWNTIPYTNMIVGATMDNTDGVISQRADILEQWRASLFGAETNALDSIAEAKTAAVNTVNTTKDDAVSEVESVKDTIINEIELKGKNTLETIPEDYVALDTKIDENKLECDKLAIVNTIGNSQITISDSSDSNLRGLHIYGKTTQQTTNGYQLFDAHELSDTDDSFHNTTLTVNDDGTFTIANSNNQNVNFYYYAEYVNVKNILKAGKNLSLKVYGTTANVHLGLLDEYGNEMYGTVLTNVDGEPNSFMLTQSILNDAVSLIVVIEGTMNATSSETIKIMLYQDGDGTFEPYTGGVPAPNVNYPQPLESIGDDGSVDVNVHGYQLFDASRVNMGTDSDTKTIGGVTFTRNGDGSFTISGATTATNSGGISYTLKHDEAVKLIKPGVINVFGTRTSDNPYVYVMLTNGNSAQRVQASTSSTVGNRSKEFPQEKLYDENYYVQIGIYIDHTRPVNLGTIKPMLYQDGDGTWEPYKSIQTLTASTPNGLPGIPVSSDGNYTDASGQQWICDEVDFGRKLYVSRIEKIMFNGSEVWKTWGVNNKVEGLTGFYMILDVNKPLFTPYKNNNILCSHMNSASVHGGSMTGCGIFDGNKPYVGICVSNDFLEDVSSNEAAITSFKKFLSLNNMSVIYAISPIETPLSDEEIAAYKALQTYKPNTSIHNSDNAHMSVDYTADTKTYIDNKFSELESRFANVSAQII